MMRAAISFVIDTDRHAQRGFDWCAHALMRAGLSKAQLRLSINIGCAVTFAMSTALRWKWFSTPFVYAAAVTLWPPVLVLFARIEWEQDKLAAARGMLSRADEGSHLGDKVWGILWSVCDAITGLPEGMIAACGRVLAERGNLCMVAFWLLLAAHGYLAKTPPDPPARQRRVLARIAPSAG